MTEGSTEEDDPEDDGGAKTEEQVGTTEGSAEEDGDRVAEVGGHKARQEGCLY